jgi:hypothetical protein
LHNPKEREKEKKEHPNIKREKEKEKTPKKESIFRLLTTSSTST